MKQLIVSFFALTAVACGSSEPGNDSYGTGSQAVVSLWWPTEINSPDSRPLAKFGDTHAHTSRSGDSDTPPATLVSTAINKGADFLWITDHGRRSDGSGNFTVSDFNNCLDTNQTSGAWGFSACGMETRIGGDKFHHIVLDWNSGEPQQFGTVGYDSWDAARADYSTAASHMTGVITHPGHTPGIGWITAEDGGWETGIPTSSSSYEYIRLIEINGATGGYSEGRDTYFRILNRGWKVSPVWATDMHNLWGGEEKPQSAGIWTHPDDWVSGNYRNAFRSAAKARATFANFPGANRYSIRMITLTSTGAPEALMGSTLARRTTVKLRIKATTTGGSKPWTFRLFKSDDVTQTSTPVWLTGDPADCTSVSNGTEQEWEPTVTLPADASWIVVEATRASSDRLLSAPIWFK